MDLSARRLHFEKLKAGQLGISPVSGSYLAEAAAFCLDHNGHTHPVLLSLSGDYEESAVLEWSEVDRASLSRSHGDLKRASEDGAYGLAIVVATETTGIPNVMKAPQGTGFDYWLTRGDDRKNFFEARLEVSGLLTGTVAEVSQRYKVKSAQVTRSDDTRLPAYICIVEFGTPEARLIQRNAKEQR
jgi:hypothetical protein